MDVKIVYEMIHGARLKAIQKRSSLSEGIMPIELIQDRGRGPEITGTRITVYNLLPYLIDPEMTENEISQIYGVNPRQIAAARAYILANPDTILAEHLRIEEKIKAGNSPEVIRQAEQAEGTFRSFREWLKIAEFSRSSEHGSEDNSLAFPSFREWLQIRARD